MSVDDKNCLENPTLQTKDFNMEMKMLKKQIKLVETYLLEFCEVNGIEERDIKNYLVVGSCPPDNVIAAVNVDDNRDIKFGTRIKIVNGENPFDSMCQPMLEVFGEYLECKDKYPKTTKLIESMGIENGRDTGDIDPASGE